MYDYRGSLGRVTRQLTTHCQLVVVIMLYRIPGWACLGLTVEVNTVLRTIFTLDIVCASHNLGHRTNGAWQTNRPKERVVACISLAPIFFQTHVFRSIGSSAAVALPAEVARWLFCATSAAPCETLSLDCDTRK